MRLPVVCGLIDRRILISYRVDLPVLARLLPSPFRPLEVQGYGIAGICLIRLKAVRPRQLPRIFGVSSENMAHRIAVEWDGPEGLQNGVFILRRDTSSLVNVLAGGRLFPGIHHPARFTAQETKDDLCVSVTAEDSVTDVQIAARAASGQPLPAESVFESMDQLSEFYRSGSVGYSPSSDAGCCDGLELRTFGWHIDPLLVQNVRSSFFDDRCRFPPGSVTFDHAVLMRGVEHEWHSLEMLTARPEISV